MYLVSERRFTSISHYRLSTLIGGNSDERKMGVCEEKRSFGVPGMRDVVARASSASDLETA